MDSRKQQLEFKIQFNILKINLIIIDLEISDLFMDMRDILLISFHLMPKPMLLFSSYVGAN